MLYEDDFIPQIFREKSTITKQVSRAIRDLRSQVPIDLIVYTKKMAERFIELDSSFSKELLTKGKILL